MKAIALKTKKQIVPSIESINNRRVYYIFFFFVVCGIVIVSRFFILQVVRHKQYQKKAQAQQFDERVVAARRGEIYIIEKDPKNRFKIATNGEDMAFTVYISPRQIERRNIAKEARKDKSLVIDFLAKTLVVDKANIEKKLVNTKEERVLLSRKKQEDWFKDVFKEDIRSFEILSQIENFTPEKQEQEKKNVERIMVNRVWDFFSTKEMQEILDKTGGSDILAKKLSILKNSGIEINTLKLNTFVQDDAKVTDILIINTSLEELLVNKFFNELSSDDEKQEYAVKGYKKDELLEAKIGYIKRRGITIETESERIYPEGKLASQIIGFLGYDSEGLKRIGQYGIEQYYNNTLSGKDGFVKGEFGLTGMLLPFGKSEKKAATDGKDLVLSLDRRVQNEMEKKLKEATTKLESPNASIIIMDIASCSTQIDLSSNYNTCGSIVAMANYPSFDPNDYKNVENIQLYKNTAITDTYEPGSVFKPITMAAALDTGKVSSNTTYNDIGSYKAKDWNKPIYNYKQAKYGNSSMTKVLEFSINTGSIFAMQQTGKETFRDYVKKFGIDQKTGIDLAGEQRGNINSLQYLSGDVTFATASFGQGIAVTSIEMLSAISAIANQGQSVKPHLLLATISESGEEQKYIPEVSTQIIKKETAAALNKMLISVIDNGIAKKIHMDGYKIAGKSGTAQMAGKGGYLEKDTIQSFIGYFPANNPRFSILVKIDKPNVGLSADSAVPLFREVVEYLIGYYNIPKE